MIEDCKKYNPRNLGKHHTDEAKRKIALSRIGKKNWLWKGDNVRYNALHEWVRNHLKKPELCETCNIRKASDLANTGIYNRDFKNWKYLCRRCHMLSDGRMNNLKQFRNVT